MTTEPLQPEDDDIRRQLAAKQYEPAFDQLIERYKNKVFRLCFSMLRDETQAEDMAQEIFLRIWKALPGYAGQASLSTWIYAISRNRCLTDLRKQIAHPTCSLDDPLLQSGLEEFAADSSASVDAGAEPVLSQLSEKYRQVITLFYLEQRSYEEVASMLALPLGTVKTFLHRAKKDLLRIVSRRPLLSSNRLTNLTDHEACRK